mgnify:CR=1 FL=1
MSVPPGPDDSTNPQLPPQVPGQAPFAPQQQLPPQPMATAGAPGGAKSFWDDDTNRLLVIIGGIFVAFLLICGMGVTAVVGMKALTGANDGHARMMGRGQNGFGPNQGGPGQGGPDSDGRGMMGQPGRGGTGGMRGADGFPGVQHGDVVITGANGQAETKRVARGTVSAATPTSLTVKSADGYESVFAIAPTTQVTGRGQSGTTPTLAVGQTVFAVGTVAGTTATADRVVITPA